MAGYWKCQRVTDGVKCLAANPNRRRICQTCGKRRPDRKRPAHMKALDIPYEFYVEINGGEFCGVCGAKPKPGRKLHRDHEHAGDGTPRGLLCWPCNALLPNRVTLERARAIVAYLERAQARRAVWRDTG